MLLLSLIATSKNIGTRKPEEETLVNRQLFHRKYQENEYLEPSLYKSWYMIIYHVCCIGYLLHFHHLGQSEAAGCHAGETMEFTHLIGSV